MIKLVSDKEIQFVKKLMRANSDAVGFIPEAGIIRASQHGGLLIQKFNNVKVGYLLFGPIKEGKKVYIWQECIDKDVRRLGAGREIFLELYKQAYLLGAVGIQLKCADDLSSNSFWKSLNFKLMETLKPDNRRKRIINIYYLSLKEENKTNEGNKKIYCEEVKISR